MKKGCGDELDRSGRLLYLNVAKSAIDMRTGGYNLLKLFVGFYHYVRLVGDEEDIENY